MAVNTRGVFSLEKVKEKQIFDEWVNLADVWVSPSSTLSPNVGYFGGGFPGPLITIDKLYYSSDTTVYTPSANLSIGRYGLAATGSSTAGYFGGGNPTTSRMDKLTYSTDTTVYTPGANLSAARYFLAATGSSTAGYFGGGSPITSTMDKLTYSTDTPSPVTSGANLSVARFYIAATGSSTAGYFGGGNDGGTPGVVSRMDKLTYSTDLTAFTPSANLNLVKDRSAATGNSTTGYFGGANPLPGMPLTKITYSTDTSSAAPTTANFSTSRFAFAATGNSTSGYFGGGNLFPNPTQIVDKLVYSTDTTVYSPGANLTASRSYLAASSPRANALSSIISTAPASPAYRFSDGTPGTPPAATPTPTTSTTNVSNEGYFAGGNLNLTMQKLNYSTDTTSPVSATANLRSNRIELAATGNSTDGYFSGGYPGPLSTMDKLTYSTNTTTLLPSTANLSVAREGLSATGNSTEGYFGGGSILGPTYYSTMDKITYSTDTTVYTPGANLSIPRGILAATSSSTAGYFGGGMDSSLTVYSRMDKLTYSTSTTVYTPSANLGLARRTFAATGNSTAGYFGGGSVPSVPTSIYYSTMNKITYSTDTPSPVPSGANLSVARNRLAATGSSTAGYFGGGTDGTVFSRMDKLTYSTDTTVYTPSANITTSDHAAVSARANALPTTATISNIV